MSPNPMEILAKIESDVAELLSVLERRTRERNEAREERNALARMLQCCGAIDAFPPYVGGDDDDISEWQAVCVCGWRGERRWATSVSAYGELVVHLNSARLLANKALKPVEAGIEIDKQ